MMVLEMPTKVCSLLSSSGNLDTLHLFKFVIVERPHSLTTVTLNHRAELDIVLHWHRLMKSEYRKAKQTRVKFQ